MNRALYKLQYSNNQIEFGIFINLKKLEQTITGAISIVNTYNKLMFFLKYYITYDN